MARKLAIYLGRHARERIVERFGADVLTTYLGREKEIDATVEQLGGNRYVFVAGLSGRLVIRPHRKQAGSWYAVSYVHSWYGKNVGKGRREDVKIKFVG